MTPFTCAREKEVAETLHRGHWPQACSPELRAHVDSCRRCSDLVLVMGSLQSARSIPPGLPNLPSAGALWWRAQLRRRSAAIESISKPIFGAQIFALAIAVVVGAGVLMWEARDWLRLASWFKEMPHAFDLGTLLPASALHLEGAAWLLPVLATVALVSGVVVYFASEKQ